MTEGEAEPIIRPLAEHCARPGWRWRWSTCRKGDHWHVAVKVHGPGEFGMEVKAWMGVSGLDEAGTLRSCVEHVMRELAKKDAIEERARAYWARLEQFDPGISTDTVDGRLARVRTLSARGLDIV